MGLIDKNEINTESSLQIMNRFWGKNVISTEEAELILLGSSKWNYSLFPKQPGCNMYFYHLDLLPRAEACSVFGIKDVMFHLQNVPAFDFHKGHLVMLSFWDEHMYLDPFFNNELLLYHLPTPFLKTTWHIT